MQFVTVPPPCLAFGRGIEGTLLKGHVLYATHRCFALALDPEEYTAEKRAYPQGVWEGDAKYVHSHGLLSASCPSSPPCQPVSKPRLFPTFLAASRYTPDCVFQINLYVESAKLVKLVLAAESK